MVVGEDARSCEWSTRERERTHASNEGRREAAECLVERAAAAAAATGWALGGASYRLFDRPSQGRHTARDTLNPPALFASEAVPPLPGGVGARFSCFGVSSVAALKTTARSFC
jgi:hypothetical protein